MAFVGEQLNFCQTFAKIMGSFSRRREL